MRNVYIGFGSNRGDRKKNILSALKLLALNKQKIIKISSLYETEPYGYKKQKNFLNGVAVLKTAMPPEELLNLLKRIEKEAGRRRSFRWGPREVDLDILFYGYKVYKSKTLSIPHADLHNRKFVLLPLNEIAPGFIHPVIKKSVSVILKNLSG